MLRGDLPSRERDHGYVVHSEFVPKPSLTLPASLQSLAALQAEYVLFTPALPYLYGQLQDAVLLDHVNRCGDPGLAVLRFDVALFSGLETPSGDADWNRSLWVVRQDAWPKFVDTLLTVANVDSQRRRVYRFGLQELQVADPLPSLVVSTTALPSVAIHAFGVRTNLWTLAFEPAGAFGLTPRVRRWPPAPDCVRFATVLFDRDDPAAALAAETEPSEP